MTPEKEAPAEQTPSPVPPAPPAETAPGERADAPETPDSDDAGDAAEGSQEPAEQEIEMLAFLAGTEEYVVPVDRVGEVLTPREITPVPHAEGYLLGVCSLRGTVMPIIDLNQRLGLAARARDERSRIIVVSLGRDDQVGLFVDRVRGVVRFLPSSVRPAPETIEQAAGTEFLAGIVRKDDRLYILLDLERTVGA